jgi:tetratricopeptide (TPR) repeat protein
MIDPIFVTNSILATIVIMVCLIALAGFVFIEHRYRMLLKRIGNLYERGQYQDALAVCDLMMKWSLSYNLHTFFVRGIVLSGCGRYAEAIDNFDRALKYEKFLGGLDLSRTWAFRGDALFYLGQLEESVRNYDKALKYQKKGGVKHQKDIAAIWCKRGRSLFDLNLVTEAVKDFENALSYDPDDWYCLTLCGEALTQLQRYEEALHSLDRALEHNPEFAPTYYCRACCYALVGNVDRAIENLDRSLCFDTEEIRNHAKTDRDLDSIRSEDRYKELVYGAG